jgi:hypothetical protein
MTAVTSAAVTDMLVRDRKVAGAMSGPGRIMLGDVVIPAEAQRRAGTQGP